MDRADPFLGSFRSLRARVELHGLVSALNNIKTATITYLHSYRLFELSIATDQLIG